MSEAAVELYVPFFGFAVSVAIWGCELWGPGTLEVSARIAEEGGNADLNGRPLWDHPEWLVGWYQDGEPYTPPLHRALPYVGGGWELYPGGER